jgi:hypothetical protein
MTVVKLSILLRIRSFLFKYECVFLLFKKHRFCVRFQEECITAEVEKKEVRSCKLQNPCQNTNTKKEKGEKNRKKNKQKMQRKKSEAAEYEMITSNEVESIKNRILKEEAQHHNSNNILLNNNNNNNVMINKNNKNNNGFNNNNNNNINSILSIPTHTPKDEIEEQTNAIPHIPNYWIPVKSKSQSHGRINNFNRNSFCLDSFHFYVNRVKN